MRHTRSLAIALIVGVALTATTALPAAAHNYVVSSTPEEGETITDVPEFFVITTNEQLLDLTGEAAGFGLQISDQNGLFYGDGCVDISGASIATQGALGGAGDYTLTYQFVSADGHTLSESVGFSYAPPANVVSVQGGSDSAPVCGGADAASDSDPQASPAGDETAAVLGIVAALLLGLAVLATVITIVVRRGRSAVEPTQS